MSDFLLELRCEEIPARMQAGARADLEKLFRAQMSAAGVIVGRLTVWSTPRRLALIAHDLPLATEAVREETKGPRSSAPPQALEGFLRKTGLTVDQLEDRDGVFFAVVEKPGRAVKSVLAEAIPAIVRAFPWPKSMRWGAGSISTESTRWVRPLSGIIALFGDELVECEAGGVTSGWTTLGHRFHHPGEITIGNAADYQDKLRACHVIVNHEERQGTVREMARAVALAEGLVLVEDEGLVVENAGLTEWPVPLLGRFDEQFLEVPPEVIQLTARVNQKYFVCTQSSPERGGGPAQLVEGQVPPGAASPGSATPPVPLHHPAYGPPPRAGEHRLANAFVCTANIEATDGGAAIVDGNRKVLAARLSDARFFWQQDRKVKLADQATKLARITFHEKLGTVADKVERVAKLARWLVEEGIVKNPPQNGEGDRAQRGGGGSPLDAAPAANPLHHPADGPPPRTGEEMSLADQAELAARLCKADLVTEMVGEFPELQGLMGGYYARAEGLPDAVADAIRDHYKPVGQGDDVPTAPVTVAVSLADKLDTLIGFFLIDQPPTGSKDPFALRRAAIAISMQTILPQIRLPLMVTLANAYIGFVETALNWADRAQGDLMTQVDRTNAALSLRDSVDRLNLLDAVVAQMNEAKGESDAAMGLLRAVRRDSQQLADKLVETVAFIFDRLKVQQREAGVRHDLIDAVFALGGEDDLVRLLARVHALQSFVGTEDGTNLLAGYKRAANILKKEEWLGQEGEIARTGEEDPLAGVDDPDLALVIAAKMAEQHERALSYTPEPAEAALIAALDAAQPQAAAAVEAEDFEGAMAALASLRAPIDAFFDGVTVNDDDRSKRAARLDLLARFRAAVHNVADFSRIEG